MKIDDYSIITWLYNEHIKTETGVPIDLKDHLFLFDIYRDFSPKQVVMKSAQIGFTTLAILKSFWVCKNKRMDAIFTMPSDSDVQVLAGGKVSRLLQNNPILLEWVRDKDSVQQKRVGKNMIYYRGTWTQQAALSVSSDLNIHDEEDRSKQAIISQYSSRLQHSDYQWEWHFSNPSVEGNGVSRYWGNSDQKHWFIRCEKCNSRQFLSWPDSIDEKRKEFVCKKCGKEISKDCRRKGQWVKKWQDKEWSGYWIPLLIAPWVSAEQILKYHEEKSPEYFANFVLGQPYVGEGNKVNPEDVLQNCTSKINSQDNIVIGVDVGLVKHFVMGNNEGIFYYGKTTEWDDIEALLKRYPRSVAVFDALPDLTKPRELKQKYPGRIWLCTFGRDRKTMQFVRWGKDKELGNVVADRNRMIQLVFDELRNKKIPLQGTRDEWQEYYTHWAVMYRVNLWEEAEQKGNANFMYSAPYRWDSATDMNHWVFACLVADTLIETDKGKKKIVDVKEGDRVFTRGGYKRVTYSGLIKKNTEVMEAIFDNGNKVIATPEHKFWTQDGWKCLHDVSTSDILVGIWNKHSTEKSIKGMGKTSILGGIGRQFIETFGNTIMGRYQKVLTFIIQIMTQAIMTYRTLSVWLGSFISLTMPKTSQLTLQRVLSAQPRLTDTIQVRINTALLNVGQRFTGSGTIKLKEGVLFVKRDSQPTLTGEDILVQNHAQIKELAKHKSRKNRIEINTAGFPVKLKSIKYLKSKEDVYGISVEDLHEYFANDVLVANSVYWRVGMDRFGKGNASLFTSDNVLAGIPTAPTIGYPNKIDPKKVFQFEEKQGNDWRL